MALRARAPTQAPCGAEVAGQHKRRLHARRRAVPRQTAEAGLQVGGADDARSRVPSAIGN